MLIVREHLRRVNPDLSARLEATELKARDFNEYSQAGEHLVFTPHGLSHVSAVEQNYDWLLSPADVSNLNPYEAFCLLVATFFHDSQMVPRLAGGEERARTRHAREAEAFLLKNRDLLGLNTGEAVAIAQIIKGHHVESLNEITRDIAIRADLVNLRKIAAILSLADICHADFGRAPQIVLRHLKMNDYNASHWRRHLQISGITRRGSSIVLSAVIFTEDGESAVRDYKDRIQQQLELIKPYFHSELSQISGVDLQLQKLDSPLDVPLRFRADADAIVRILTAGVYERKDVFLRELVQNSFDACHLRLANRIRRSGTSSYRGEIAVTSLIDNSKIRAIRIDDNGIGIDITDVQETVLSIGDSIARKESIQTLLRNTTEKNLIATFGIGLLSCFNVATQITIRSAKEAQQPLEFTMRSLQETIQPRSTPHDETGTTVIVELRDEVAQSIDFSAAIAHYFRTLPLTVSLRCVSLEWTDNIAEQSRAELLRIVKNTVAPVAGHDFDRVAATVAVSIDIENENCTGKLCVPIAPQTNQPSSRIQILSSGIFVCEDQATQWLPRHLSSAYGTLNFATGAVRLPVARDNIIKDESYAARKKELSGESEQLIDKLIKPTKRSTKASRNNTALTLARIFETAEAEWKTKIIGKLDDFHVRIIGARNYVSLGELRRQTMYDIYIVYPESRFVERLGVVDGKQLWHKPDDFAQLQAALLTQDGTRVISLERDDSAQDTSEANLIEAYCAEHGLRAVNLSKVSVIGEKLRSKPLPRELSESYFKNVRFVEVSDLPRKKAWVVEDSVWINIAQPQMLYLYNKIKDPRCPSRTLFLASATIDLMRMHFDDAVDKMVRMIIR